jgi:hypothetical protein
MKTTLKKTWDSKLDTFRVEYLLIGSGFMAVIWHPDSKHYILEVDRWFNADALGLFNFSRSSRYPPSIVSIIANWGSGNNHNALSIRIRSV